MDSKLLFHFLFPLPFHVQQAYILFNLINHMERINLLDSSEPHTYLQELIHHFKKKPYIDSIYFPPSLLQGKGQEEGFPFSTSLPKQQQERERLMESIYSSMLPFPSYKQAFIIPRVITFKRKIIQKYLLSYGNLGFL